MEGDVVSVQPAGVAKVVARLTQSSLGLKALVAVTGLGLVAFAFVHMAGHLQMFALLGGQEGYNQYAHKLQSLGALKWAARAGLLALTLVHVIATLKLIARNRSARPIGYASNHWLTASVASQTMRVTGPILLFFIIYHLLHFTALVVSAQGYEAMEYMLRDGSNLVVGDAYGRMVQAFRDPLLTVVYVLAVGLLGVHLAHGISSLFQTLGLTNSTYRPALATAGPLLAGLLTAGFAVVPLAILTGVIQ